VYATWDDEGIHIDPMTGEEVYHQKGEYKTDY
jgi:YHS domain-containing protein